MKRSIFRQTVAALVIAVAAFAGCKDDPAVNEYAITVTASEGGTAQADKAKAEEGATITLTAAPAEGYVFDKWTAVSGSITLSNATTGTATFVMPAGDVSVKAEFVKVVNRLITGKFKSQTGEGDAVFYADYASESKSAMMIKSAATEKELTGKIEDGDIIFNLNGIYDTETGKFFLSAGSSFLIYQIAGAMTDGDLGATEAAVKVKSGDEWEVHTVEVTAAEDTEIEADADAQQEEGIPSRHFGTWHLKFDQTGEGYEDQTIVVTSFQWVNTAVPDEPAGLIDIEADASGQNYSMIFQGVVTEYYLEEGIVNRTLQYVRITAQESGEQLRIKYYWDSASEDYATTLAYDIATADPETVDTSTMTRID